MNNLLIIIKLLDQRALYSYIIVKKVKIKL
jgi:hypothetical protein